MSHNLTRAPLVLALIAGGLLASGEVTAQADDTPAAAATTQNQKSVALADQSSVTLTPAAQPAEDATINESAAPTTDETTPPTTTTDESEPPAVDSATPDPVDDSTTGSMKAVTNDETTDSTATNPDTITAKETAKTIDKQKSPEKPVVDPTTPKDGTTTAVRSTTATPTGLAKTAAKVTPQSDPADDELVMIADPTLEQAVRDSFSLKGDAPLTYGVIRRYGTNGFDGQVPLNIKIINGKTITSFEGLDALKYLPQNKMITFYATIADDKQVAANLDFSPLVNLRFKQFEVSSNYFGAMSDTALQTIMQIDPTIIDSVSLSGSLYMKNKNGMTNRQLAILGPWLTTVANNGHGAYGFNHLTLTNNCLTDFTPLSGITTKDAWITAIGQYYDNPDPINIVIGQPAIFSATESIGFLGEPLIFNAPYSFNANDEGTYAPITNLGNGKLQIDTPFIYDNDPINNWITYGPYGFIFAGGPSEKYVDVIYPNNIELQYDVRIYRQVNWLEHPQLTIKLMTTDGQELATVDRDGKLIGDAFDVTDLTKRDGYTFVADKSDDLTGTYQQDPQTLTLVFKKTPPTVTPPGGPDPETPETPDPGNPEVPETPDPGNPGTPGEPGNPGNVVTPGGDGDLVTPDKPGSGNNVQTGGAGAGSTATVMPTATGTLNHDQAQQQQAALPQTDESSQTFLATLGAACLALLSGLGLALFKRR
ncbi:MucBP domain-containing protein [Levilactobacillus andaensis]|uniref:MucBP domain-containing protein n=1 Tax=Levilactobacillus andaensis TaxID=2799570 RepID=UPI001940B8ED|nr:MucBP domain-containing protein [Levilactobacillus andaensis]